ncbi:MAG: tRNA1(Val) (adenine(37)-N6)-methyltransferase, partial [Bacillota bacterium]
MEERNELIKNEMDIIQNDKFFKFGTDSVLLANFVESKSRDLIADFGSGSGVIPLLLAFKNDF